MAKFSKKDFIKLFIITFKLSAVTFGGGFIIIPLMRQKFVEELHWLDEDEMLDLTVIAQSSPGSISVNASILIGYRVAGMLGALTAVLGTALPPLIIISIVSLFYRAFRDNLYVHLVMKGMLPAVAAVIFDVVFRMGKNVLKDREILPIIVMILSFISVHYFHVNILLVILICALIGGWNTLYQQKRKGDIQS
ncbi:chromate transporter [Aerococcaceae bacterium zg-ZUI334]|uniref:chromate transporter n=1 Tax=Aerococcaceae bacterium zg-252 TaxID=2796928 RepID=UPI001B9DC2A5|nr:chromate transporter [Aerococcaceae bacterium zg-ZUI334]